MGQTNNPELLWSATFKSMSSGNTKTFSGTADQLSQFKKIAEKNTPGMQQDQIAVELKFLSTDVVMNDTLPYSKAIRFYENHSYLQSDCEEYEFYFGRGSSKRIWFLRDALQSKIDENSLPAQGKGSLYMMGETKYSGKKFYLCCLTYEYTLNTEMPGSLINNATPENTWISFYLKGNGIDSSFFRISVVQSEEGTLLNNHYYKDISLAFTGWKYIAIPYSELKWMKTDNIPRTNLEKNCSKIITINYILCSTTDNGKASVNLDYMSLLFGGGK